MAVVVSVGPLVRKISPLFPMGESPIPLPEANHRPSSTSKCSRRDRHRRAWRQVYLANVACRLNHRRQQERTMGHSSSNDASNSSASHDDRQGSNATGRAGRPNPSCRRTAQGLGGDNILRKNRAGAGLATTQRKWFVITWRFPADCAKGAESRTARGGSAPLRLVNAV